MVAEVEQPGETASQAVSETYGGLPFLIPAQGHVVGAMGVYADGLRLMSDMEIMQSLFGALRATRSTSKPEILVEESCQKAMYLPVALNMDQTH